MSNHPIEMFNYHTWATATILGRLKELPSSVPHQEVNSSFPTIAHALSHMYAIDAVWYNITTMIRQLGFASTMNDYSLYWYVKEASK